MTVRLVIFGRQGAGKGTQCVNIVKTYGVAHISTGDMLRAAVGAGTDMGLRAKEVMDSGGLVGDDIMNGIVADRLSEPDAAGPGFVLDGYPRTQPQAEALLSILGDESLDAVINLDVPLDEVTARMKSRGREDDTDEAIERRLALYEQETRPVLDFFDKQGLLVTVDGLGTEEEVSSRLILAVNELL
ncbi:MAG: adenylate kinase [Acidimicrobiales bacterium]|nr:adenylate kinase [Acidimicrobiales bacterium]